MVKKVLTAALALVMCLGISVVGYAWDLSPMTWEGLYSFSTAPLNEGETDKYGGSLDKPHKFPLGTTVSSFKETHIEPIAPGASIPKYGDRDFEGKNGFVFQETKTEVYTFDKAGLYFLWQTSGPSFDVVIEIVDTTTTPPVATTPTTTADKPTETTATTPIIINATGMATVVNCNALHIRRGAGVSFEAFNHLVSGDVVKVLEKKGNWYKVENTKGIVGWAYGKYLEPVH